MEARTRPVRAALTLLTGVAVTGALLVGDLATAAPVTVGQTPSPTFQTNGRVDAMITVGNTVYIGGRFTSVRPAGSAVGTDSVPRNRLAAFSAATGQLLPWNPGANSTVNALAASPDGHTIYVGGRFGRLGGHTRHNLGAVRAGTGALTRFRADTDRRVLALAASGSRVYVGGKISQVKGRHRSRLAALSVRGQVLRRWQPSVNGNVQTIAVTHQGVFIGGNFTRVRTRKQPFLARLTAKGARVERLVHHPGYPVVQIVATRHRLFLAGDGAGGHAASYTTRGGFRWVKQTDGVVHSIAFLRGVLYVGGQFDNICVGNASGPTSGFDCPTVLTPRRRLAALAGADGSALPWNPGANSIAGVFAVTRVANNVQIGGDFTLVHQVDQQGYASFAP
jgi:hypothetical protein